MSTPEPATLEEVIRDAGESRLLDDYEPRSKAMTRVLCLLSETRERAAARGLGGSVRLDELAIVREYSRNALHVKAFLQALRITATPEMLMMIWRILQGMEIQSVHIAHERLTSFIMRVVLRSPYGGDDETYETSVAGDLRLLRHVGAYEINGKPVFDGFYPRRDPRSDD